MSKNYVILVTGCGGDIGQSICKILSGISFVHKIIGCDIHERHPGKFLVSDFRLVPRCTDKQYFPAMEALIKETGANVVISASEPELRFFLQQEIQDVLFSVPVVMANAESLRVGFDKLATSQFLEQHGLPFPKTFEVKKMAEPLLPSIMKSRNGSGSKQLIHVSDHESFQFYQKRNPDFIVQEYLEGDNHEYTCGLFRSRNGVIRSLQFNRTLQGGFSNFGVVTNDLAIRSLLISLAEKLQLIGSINVQLRKTNKGAVIFEINPRFSSTVLFRHLLGFEDLVWSIQDRLGLPLSDYTDVAPGRKFYKGYHEYVE